MSGGERQPSETMSGARLWLTILAVMLPTAVYVLDLTIVTVALPHMQGSFSATADQIAWVLTSYLVGQSIVTACSGWLSQRFGRKQIYLLSTVGFTIMSVFCGMASDLHEEVAFRALQGMLGAPLLPLSQAILLDLFPREKHGAANSIWGMGILIGPVLGPVVGGVLTEAYSWPWVFFVNVPVLIPTVFGVWLLVPRTAKNTGHRLDWFGFTALILAVGAFQLMLNRGEREDWFASTEIAIEAGIAAIFLYVFLVHSFTSRRPFVRPGIFANRNYSLAVIFVFFFAILIQAPIVLLSLYFQNLGGYPVEEVGWLLTPRGVSAFASMMLCAPLMARMDGRLIMMIGLACFGVSTLFMSQWTPDVDSWTVAWTGLIQGVGSGFAWVPLGTLAYATLAPRDMDDGIAMVHLTFTIGASIGIVAVINVMLTGTVTSHAVLTEFITPFTQTLAGDAARSHWDLEARQGLAVVDSMINRQAGVIGYSNAFLVLTVIAFAQIPFVWLLVLGRGGGHADTAGPAKMARGDHRGALAQKNGQEKTGDFTSPADDLSFGRILLRFLICPTIPLAMYVVGLSIFTKEFQDSELALIAFLSITIAVPVCLFVGIPFYFIYRKLRISTLLTYAMTGVCLALVFSFGNTTTMIVALPLSAFISTLLWLALWGPRPFGPKARRVKPAKN